MEVTLRPVTSRKSRPTSLRRPGSLKLNKPGRTRASLARRLVAASRWSAWAGRLSGRYRPGWAGWARLATRLSLAPATGVPGPVYDRTRQVNAGPVYLTLHLAIPAARQAAALPGWTDQAQPVSPPAVQAAGSLVQMQFHDVNEVLAKVSPPAGQAVSRLVSHLRQRELWSTTRRETELVERILARRESRESSGAPAGPWAEVAPPLPRVVNRPASPPAQMPPAPAAGPPPGLNYWSEAGHTPPAPPINVEHLADQVIHAIDQRVIAARERRGIGKG